MKKIIHLSDLHLENDEGSGANNTAFEDIIVRLEANIDHPENHVIVVTGDLVDKAKNIDDYQPAIDGLNALEKKGFRCLVVPGNHDYGEGTRQEGKMVGVFKQAFYGNKGGRSLCFPVVDIIDGIAFIGLDSMEAKVINGNNLADGQLGDRQLADLAYYIDEDSEVKECKKVVYLHHRVFNYFGPGHELKKRDRKALLNITGNKISALLFGHRHQCRSWNGENGIPRIYDAGSSTGHESDLGDIRIIDLENAPEGDKPLP